MHTLTKKKKPSKGDQWSGTGPYFDLLGCYASTNLYMHVKMQTSRPNKHMVKITLYNLQYIQIAGGGR